MDDNQIRYLLKDSHFIAVFMKQNYELRLKSSSSENWCEFLDESVINECLKAAEYATHTSEPSSDIFTKAYS